MTVSETEAAPRTLVDWVRHRRAQLRLSVRIVVASLASFLIAHLLGFVQGYWAVLTAVIVMQASVGGALKATIDRFVGTLGGAIWGVAVSLYVPHTDVWTLGLALAVAITPLAVLTALQPSYRVAPVTAVILLLTPTSMKDGPVQAAILRLGEIGLGSVVAIAVSLLVLPARAHALVADAAGKTLGGMGRLTGVVMAGMTAPIDADAVQALHDEIRRGIAQAEAAAGEALQERSRFLSNAPDQEPICRTLRRARNDLAMVGRALPEPLPEPVGSRLAAPAAELTLALGRFFQDAGDALAVQTASPSLDGVERALNDYAAAVAELRSSGLARQLPDEMVGRVFGMAFALEQLHQNLIDLTDRINELATPSRG